MSKDSGPGTSTASRVLYEFNATIDRSPACSSICGKLRDRKCREESIPAYSSLLSRPAKQRQLCPLRERDPPDGAHLVLGLRL